MHLRASAIISSSARVEVISGSSMARRGGLCGEWGSTPIFDADNCLLIAEMEYYRVFCGQTLLPCRTCGALVGWLVGICEFNHIRMVRYTGRMPVARMVFLLGVVCEEFFGEFSALRCFEGFVD